MCTSGCGKRHAVQAGLESHAVTGGGEYAFPVGLLDLGQEVARPLPAVAVIVRAQVTWMQVVQWVMPGCAFQKQLMPGGS